jgi:hypothetical protein
MNDVFDCMQVHDRMPADLNKGIATQPLHDIGQRVVGGKLFPHSVNPGPPVTSQYCCNLVTSQQPYPIAIYVFNP